MVIKFYLFKVLNNFGYFKDIYIIYYYINDKWINILIYFFWFFEDFFNFDI